MFDIISLRDEAAQKLVEKTGCLAMVRIEGECSIADLHCMRMENEIQQEIETPAPQRPKVFGVEFKIATTKLLPDYSLMPIGGCLDQRGKVGESTITFVIGDAFIDTIVSAEQFHDFTKKLGYCVRDTFTGDVSGELGFLGLEFLYRYDRQHRRIFKRIYANVTIHRSPWELACDALRDFTLNVDVAGSSLTTTKATSKLKRKMPVGRPQQGATEAEQMALSIRQNSKDKAHKDILIEVRKDHPNFTMEDMERLFTRIDQRQRRQQSRGGS